MTGGPLQSALAAEEAAVYAYGLIGVRFAADSDRTEARAAEQAHRNRRDTLVSRTNELKVQTGPAPAAYEMPFPVTDRAGAIKLAIQVEDGVAQAWRAVLPATEGGDRGTALAALTDAAVRATRWRRLGGAEPMTTAFPGKVG